MRKTHSVCLWVAIKGPQHEKCETIDKKINMIDMKQQLQAWNWPITQNVADFFNMFARTQPSPNLQGQRCNRTT